MKSFFPIIMWLEAAPKHMNFNQHTAAAFFDRSFEDIASLNCNTVRPSNLPLPYVDQLMTSAANHGLKVILDPQWGHNLMQMTPTQILNSWETKKAEITRDVINPFSGYENLLGYAVTDEPPADKIEQWKLTVKMFHELDPAHPDYTCFNKPGVLENVVNDDSVPQANCVFDNYPHEKSVPINTMGNWYSLYKDFYDGCKARPHLPQISTVAVFKNDRPWRRPTPTEFRTTIYTSLAAGATGIMFFIYMDFQTEVEKFECLVDSDWKPYPFYHTVKDVAAELKQVGPILPELRRSGDVTGWHPSNRTLRITYQDPIERRYFIIANKDPDPDHRTIKRYLRLKGPTYCLEDIYTGDIFKANDNGAARITLPPAHGRVLKERIAPGPPFGSFDSPEYGSQNLSGAVAVTGWALDDIGVDRVEIKRSPVLGEPGTTIGSDGLVFIGNAVFVEGARPDVAEKYPDYPNNHKAGWGYMLLTNFLPNKGNGVFLLHATAYDIDGNSTPLGQKTITCNNAQSKKPFGTIDTPSQGGTASGKRYVNWGWVLTPPPNRIPYDGKTIKVFIDGKFIGHPNYGIRREDIVSAFPECLNNQEDRGGVGYMIIDTTTYENGIHTISWAAVDSAGNKEGIGSRYFRIQN
ncbi:MAG: hypothetical protein GTO45_12615 [Candidatus Aminicenantes bacterium]|nr:hypothetical protein [Candidatus Aminicenantes bacterium]NIM79627.1 hypothetical protein [Candidatus Aminicenantes bacterium]NIN18953.1 hypothetical protein [Candidatus Aminicenantes bacterium]NIN42855.1 hypothetical protein [Candidatus Aminicenantes bacterium]NIN85592.1 hypothetical protein [Candidatus Aminicenantes bacterium]